MYIHTQNMYIHTHKHVHTLTYVHTYIHTYIHTYMHHSRQILSMPKKRITPHAARFCMVTPVPERMHLYIHTYIHTYMNDSRQLLGMPKQKESLRTLLASRHYLKLNFGNIVVKLGEPILVNKFLTDNKVCCVYMHVCMCI